MDNTHLIGPREVVAAAAVKSESTMSAVAALISRQPRFKAPNSLLRIVLVD